MVGTRRSFFARILPGMILLLLLMLPAGALAAGISDLWVTGAASGDVESDETGDNLKPDAIHWWYSNRNRTYYLFLPAGTDTSKMKIWFKSTGDSILMGEHTVYSGDSAAVLTPGEKMIVDAGSKKYTLQVMQSANIPALFMTTDSGSLYRIHSKRANTETGSLIMLNPDGSMAYSGKLDQIKGRGNSTFAYPKKPYQIKLTDATDLCGMGKARTYVLLANYEDNSLIRNTIAFALADAAGLYYTSKFQAVDLYINNNYLGSYLMCEKAEIGDSRIDITNLEKATEAINEKPLDQYPAYGTDLQYAGLSKGFRIPNNPADITGGYLLELEKPHRYTPEVSGFKTKKGFPVVIKEPEYASKEQAEYAKAMIQSFENAIFSEDGIDPATGKSFDEIADMESLAKKYVLEEFSKNLDANRTSFYIYKPEDAKDTRFYAGPVWDYDIAFGNFAKEKSRSLTVPTGFYANDDRGMPFYWFPALYTKQAFYEQAVKAYHASYVPAIKALLGMEEEKTGKVLSIDAYASEVEASAAMNFIRWPVFNAASRQVKTGKDYAENIAYLKDFIQKRMDFLNESWVQPK